MRSYLHLIFTTLLLPVCLSTPLKVYFEHQGLVCLNICLGAATEFVCGSDGITHTNPCTLQGYNCSGLATKTVVTLHQGPCMTTEPSKGICNDLTTGRIQCPEKKDPVCGKQDHRTYSNYCELLNENCRILWTLGRRPGIDLAYRDSCT